MYFQIVSYTPGGGGEAPYKQLISVTTQTDLWVRSTTVIKAVSIPMNENPILVNTSCRSRSTVLGMTVKTDPTEDDPGRFLRKDVWKLWYNNTPHLANKLT